jgi:dolichyl-phosphate beta-glucosyltransferase
MQLSLIIPTYKGARTLKNNLPRLLEYLRKAAVSFEVIVVDDGSEDNGETERIVVGLGCRFVKNEKNLGKGGAVRNGMRHATGDFRIYTDVDIPFEYAAFDTFLRYLDFKEFDVVVGDRTLPESSYFAEISWFRNLGSRIFTFIVGRFVAGGYFDTQCGMKGFRAAVADDLFAVSRINGFAFDVELLYISLKRNYDIKRLPVKLRCQEGSTVNLLFHGPGMLKDLFRIKYHHVRGKYNRRGNK